MDGDCEAEKMRRMVVEHTAVNKMNRVGFFTILLTFIFNVCCFSGMDDYEWSHIVPHSPSNTHYIQKWCVCLGAFAAVSDWNDITSLKEYLKSKYTRLNILPLNVLYHRQVEAINGHIVVMPTFEYLKRTIYLVEKWLKSKEDSMEPFGVIEIKNFVQFEEWVKLHPELGESPEGGDRYSTSLPEPYLGNSIPVCKYRLWPFSGKSLFRSTCPNGKKKTSIHQPYFKETGTDGNGNTPRSLPASFEEPLDDFYLTADIALVAVMSMSIIEMQKDILQKEYPINGVEYRSEELDILLLMCDYLLHLIESDCASHFRGIQDLPEHVTTIQDTVYRPSQHLGFARPPQGNANLLKGVYKHDPLETLMELEVADREMADNIGTAMASADESSSTLNTSVTGQFDQLEVSNKFKLVPSSVEELAEEAGEDDVRSDYMHLSDHQLVELGQRLYAALSKLSHLRELKMAFKIRQLGRPLAYRWARRVKGDEFTTLVDSLDLKLDTVKDLLREEGRDDLVRQIDAADHESALYRPSA